MPKKELVIPDLVRRGIGDANWKQIIIIFPFELTKCD